MSQSLWHVAEFRDGQVLGVALLPASEDEALEAAGLSE